jgi:hypothetical protein
MGDASTSAASTSAASTSAASTSAASTSAASKPRHGVITYATRDERYFQALRASVPGVTVYGWGVPWRGFSDKCAGAVRHCRGVDPGSVVVVLDGFDAVAVAGLGEAVDKFVGKACRVLFSMDACVGSPYLADKVFGKCRGLRLNTGMYIGYAADIAHFWRDLRPGQDDQAYATGACEENASVLVDDRCDVFYNIDARLPEGSVRVVDDATGTFGKRLVIRDGRRPCYMSSPALGDMNPLLRQLGFDEALLPDLKQASGAYALRVLRDMSPMFVAELAAAFCIAVTLVLLRRRPLLAAFAAFLIFCEVLHYQVYAKHKLRSAGSLAVAVHMAIDALHVAITLGVFYLFFASRSCDKRSLLLLNTLYLGVVFQFFVLRRCVLSVAANSAVGERQDARWPSADARAGYILRGREPYVRLAADPSDQWMSGNVTTVTIVLCANAFCLGRAWR